MKRFPIHIVALYSKICETFKVIYNRFKILKIFYFIFVLFYSCNYYKIKISCLGIENESSNVVRKKIVQKIDSVYKSKSHNYFKRILSSKCLDNSTLEVKVLTMVATIDLFYFNNKVNLIEVKHTLKDLN